jgi:hypothetical protein
MGSNPFVDVLNTIKNTFVVIDSKKLDHSSIKKYIKNSLAFCIVYKNLDLAPGIWLDVTELLHVTFDAG